MRLRVVLPLFAALAGGCSTGTTEVAGSCTFVARVGDIDYAAYGEVTADKVGAEYTRTLRRRDCDDVIVFGEPAPERWRSGDSSFPAGTPLFASKEHPTSDVLLVQWSDGKYLQLRKLPHPGSPANPTQ